ncbi:MAG TPA: histidine kinase [Ruminococcaceae bacterium]|jgi:two-component system sensor histidine kinase KdpD|nr:histidine kinase [Oscillospiraceae bacterium]HBG55211.1 histidine kinase [Oscillospiraceae bacterium]HBQ45578.1 histidine kinase [Oscillospiraceae bacterium]HCB91516.1 histidine kinase [Oscillospiraceae bacterium]
MAIHQTDPDALLRQLSALPAKKPRGRLRIYLGYAAGVGKTFAMLGDARGDRKNGADVAAGYVEPHGRPATAALLKGLEVLPPLKIPGAGAERKEFDLDGALRRRPEIVLVDDLAHTNARGCRHKKRYQDVEELLQAGISVYTTVDIRHVESLNDIVVSITGAAVRERIPDSVFDRADQVELVDIAPDALIDRLQKGEVYRKNKARRALRHSFTREKLTALREVALRYAADQSSRAAAQRALRGRAADGGPASYGKEHILVCLSSAPSNAKVVRAAARMADAFHGAFTALFVETPGTRELEGANRAALRGNLRLAEQLGAQIATVYGEDIPEQIAEYAKVSRVSKIVMGRTGHLKGGRRKSGFVDKLISLAPNLDIYIIPDTQPARRGRAPRFTRPPRLSFADAAKSAALLALCTLIAFWFASLGLDDANLITVYILGVLVDAMVTNSWVYSTVLAFLSMHLFDLMFLTPRLPLWSYLSGYPVSFLVMLSAALITSALTRRVKKQARQSAQKAYRTEVLLETSRKLQQAKNEEEILRATARQMVKLLDRTVIFYPVRQNALSEPIVFPKENPAQDPQACLGTEERAVAEWVYKNNKHAGATTNTLSAARCLYLAVRGGNTVLAVAAVAMDREAPLEAFEKSLTIAMLGECALALEKERLNQTQKRISVQMQQEKLRANLLRTISHDLRTPLTSISGNAGVLMKNSKVLSEEQKQGIYTDIYDDSMWLIELVENLLSITRIENGKIKLNLQPELLEDVIDEALRHINRNGKEHHIRIALSDEFLMAKMDARLIIQVIINIVDNAVKYTQKGSHITVSAKRDGGAVRVEIADDGPGIPDGAKARLFDMFYTAGNAGGDGRRGLGLGLYLCRAILHAHGGTIYVRDNVPRGTVFGFTLQAAEVHVDG